MNSCNFIPISLRAAGKGLRRALHVAPNLMTPTELQSAWSQIAYLLPNLHPDSDENDWPRVLRPFHAEARRRIAAGTMDEEQFYPSDAQWCGLFDRLENPNPSEIERRASLARKGKARS